MEKEDTPNPRAAHVKAILKLVADDVEHWAEDFKRMKENRKFARGLQWPGMKRKDLTDPDRAYVANITMRDLKQRTATTYARNPRFVWHRSQRLYSTTWDGTATMLQQALMMVQQGIPDPTSVTVLREAAVFAEEQKRYEGIGKTLAFLYEWSLREQIQPTKRMMKRTVLQAGTCGVGYVKQSYQRKMGLSPDTETALHDARSQMATAQRLAMEMQEGELQPDDADMDRLKTLIQNLENSEQVMIREGLRLDYPDPLNIIPSKDLVFLPGFYGCEWVTERFFMTPDRVRETYGIELGTGFKAYRSEDPRNVTGNRHAFALASGEKQDGDCACVFETYHRGDGVVYVTCEGYDDFLRDPVAPEPWTERFWPWFVYAPNALDDPENPFPPSDVELGEPMAREINRAGEALRDHRYAARPGHVKAGGMTEEDAKRISARAAHAVVPIEGMGPDQKIGDILQAFPTSPIDPNLYETGSAFQDFLRTKGTQEANLGPTSSATATESAIAQSSRQSTDDSMIDELDDLLTEMARAGAQILLMNMDAATVKEIVGPGAVWPEMSRAEVSREIYLECEAGSSGRRNQAQDIQVRTQMYPMLFQISGLSQEKMAKDMLNVMDPRITYEDFIDYGALSVVAANSGPPQPPVGAPNAPTAQGAQGAANAPTPEAGGVPKPTQPQEAPGAGPPV